MECLNNSSDIKNIFYINLDRRIDRKQHIEGQMKLLNWQAQRFPAISHKFGALGCSLSHLMLVNYAKQNNLDHILILEDDVTFLNPALFLNSLNNFLKNHKDFDVLLLAGNNMGDYQRIDDFCVKVSHCQTTTAYLVKRHYYDTLIDNYQKGISLLRQNPSRLLQFTIDQYWGYLQIAHKWYLLTPLSVIQRPDMSDIEKRQTNYRNLMLNLDQSKLITNKLNIIPKF
jgi:glycosyl transferase family 25